MSRLICSCCGNIFKGKPDSSQDKGYGTCPECVTWVEETFDKPMREGLRKKVHDNLNEKNRAKFDAMTIEEQDAICFALIDKGVIKWTIKSVHS